MSICTSCQTAHGQVRTLAYWGPLPKPVGYQHDTMVLCEDCRWFDGRGRLGYRSAGAIAGRTRP